MKSAVAAAATTVRRDRAAQQPEWTDLAQVQRVRAILAGMPPLVRLEDVRMLRSLLAHVAAGEAHVIQAGDCAEDPDDCTAEHIGCKGALLDLLAGTLKMTTHTPVLRVGRIAGQYAKPRSSHIEQVGDRELPAFRGHMVNAPDPDPEARSPDPLRILGCYMAARQGIEQLAWRRPDVGGERLPRLVEAVRRAGHPVIWLCDAMHGNTIAGPDRQKIRLVATIMREVREFRRAVAAGGGVAGGLHLETTPEEVTECVADASALSRTGRRSTSLCDPRLNCAQAISVVSAWSDTS